MNRKIICFDLDNTLLDHRTMKVPESSLRALDALREKGSIIVLATGRDMDNYYSRQYLDIVRPDARIEQNGSKVLADGKLLYEHFIDKGLLRRMMDYAAENGVGLGITIGDEDIYVNPEVVEEAEIRRWGECGRQFRDPERLMALDIRTVAFIGTDAQARAMEQVFPEVSLRMFSIDYGADVIEKGFSKAEGLKRLLQHYNVDPADTVAFGDSLNDLELLKECALGIAMGNGREELKQAADYVTDPIGEDGIWNACVRFGLI
jgi:Cof subfamily protein (haloacid dehalogenase superfamily)